MNKEYKGFIAPIITPEHFVMGEGKVPFQVVKSDGDWTPDLPKAEFQSKEGLETDNCTGFGMTKMISEYIFNAFGIREEYSERWVGIISGTNNQGGNDPQTVLDAIRKYGLIPESMLPFSDDITTVDDYYSFKGSNRDVCYEAGKEWLEKYTLYHEWVFDPSDPITEEERIHNMVVALKYSPLGIGVYAWAMDDRGIYVKLGGENHWTNCYKIDDFLNIFDSYEPFLKKAEQAIIYCKRIHIERNNDLGGESTSIGSVIIKWIRNLIC